MLKEYIIALSLANLCFYNIILAFFYKSKFYLRDWPGLNQLLALILSELLIATLFWLAWRLVKKINNRYLILFAKFIVCLLVLIFIYDIARDFKAYFNIKLFRVCLLVLLIISLIKKKTAKVATSFLLLMVPFIVIIFFQAFQGIIIDLNNRTDSKIEQQLFPVKNNSPRVLWLIFDGLDYRNGFIDKPKHLEMPAFERIQRQAIIASNAFPPGNKTRNSIPALIDGKIITEAIMGGYDKLYVSYLGSNELINWGSQPNVFSKAHELQLNTALVGEYLPYSRLIGKHLTYCDWYQYYPQYTSSGSIIANMYQQIRMLLIGPARHYVQRKESYLGVQNQTKKLVSNPNYNLIVIHNPIPHYPFFHQQPWWDDRSPEGYINTLKLVDQSLAEIRQIMEKQKTWDQTNVIISADHGQHLQYNGKEEKRVPFIIKLANQKNSVIYEPSFNTVVTQKMVLAILRSEIASPDEVVNFLRENGEIIEPAVISD